MKKTLVICSLVIVMLCTSCSKSEPTMTDSSSSKQAVSSETVSSTPVSSEVSSVVSSETPSSAQVSSVPTSAEAVASTPPSSAVSSKAPKVESKVEVSSKTPTSSKQAVSSQPPVASSKAEAKPVSESTTNFGDLMDEAVVDAIIAEGIEYANSKGMTWYEDFTVEGSGYYNPAFSGHGGEIFKRDLFYHIDQLYDLVTSDPDYYDGCLIYYKIVKGEFHEKGYWYGYVLY